MATYVRYQSARDAAQAMGLKVETIRAYFREGAPHDKINSRVLRCNVTELRSWLIQRAAQQQAAPTPTAQAPASSPKSSGGPPSNPFEL